MAALDLATFGLMEVGPESRVGLGIEQSDPGVAFGNGVFGKSVQANRARILAIRNRVDVGAAAEEDNQIRFVASIGNLKMTPLIQFKDGGVLKLSESGFIFDEDGMG